MAIKLFDIQNKQVVPSEHCFTIEPLKQIMDKYPKDYDKVYAYLFYMSCLNDEENPFANTPEADKEDLIMKAIKGKFSTDDENIFKTLELVKKLYETPTSRMYLSIKIVLENLGKYLQTTTIHDGRDGNILAVLRTAEKFDDVCRSFESRYKAFKEENNVTARGGHDLGYDQK